jgi:hypothetical protein
MKTPSINLEVLLEEAIKVINTQHEETFKVFSWDIKQTKEDIALPLPKGMENLAEKTTKNYICKTIYLYSSDTRTNDREAIYKRKLVLKTAADVLRYNYKLHLLKVLFLHLLHFSLINLAYIEKEKEIEYNTEDNIVV